MKTQVNADQLIRQIGAALAEWDGPAIAEIANQVLVSKVIYLEDSVFEVEDHHREDQP